MNQMRPVRQGCLAQGGFATAGAPWDEEARLGSLERTGILDTKPEPEFDSIAWLASRFLNAPVALVSFVARDRQWFKARVGIGVSQTCLDVSICRHLVLGGDILVVPDLLEDPRFAENPLVVEGPRFRFYAGAVIRSSDGLPIGTVCVLDDAPRPDGISADQETALRALAATAEQSLQLRSVGQRLHASERRYRALVEATASVVWSTDSAGRTVAREASAPFVRHGRLQGERWEDLVHPDDRSPSEEAWRRALETTTPLDVTERKRTDTGEFRWTHVRAVPVRGADGAVSEWIGAATDVHDRIVAEKRLEASQERLRLALEATGLGIWDIEPATGRQSWSREVFDILGLPPVERPGLTDFVRRLHPADRRRFVQHFAGRSFSTDVAASIECRIRRANDGAERWIHVRGLVRPDQHGDLTRYVGTVEDITTRKHWETAVRNSERRLRLALQAARMVAWELNVETGVVERSSSSRALLGIGSGHRREFLSRVRDADRGRLEELVETARRGEMADVQVRYRRDDGERLWLGVRAETLDQNRIVGVTFDLTERKAAEAQLWQAANHDALTGLPNRALFNRRLETALNASRKSGETTALMLIDLDSFKEVNDTLGHDAGDVLLTETARRLKRVARRRDTIARLGGDEFAVIAPRCGPGEVAALSERIIAALAEPIGFSGMAVQTSASIGIACAPEHHERPDELMKDADIALYRAKARGRGQVAVYEPAMRAATERRFFIVREMRHAIEANQMVPFYQPKVDLRDGRVTGIEALARYRHPQHGLRTPAYFKDVFGEPDLAVALGEALARRVAEDTRSLISEDLVFGRMAINLAAAEFEDATLADRIMALLDEHGIRAADFEVEVTETVFLGKTAKRAAENLDRLNRSGILIALDDFGTGFASLTHLKEFPVGRLKIDQSFVRGLGRADDDLAIVRAVVGLGRNLGIPVTAEGIETRGQARLLADLGCDHGQGYLYAKPMPIAQLRRFLRRRSG
jgi:diguanylate cyclase (GGDEF)-like protein/PAS domain S-box-containing protein